MTGNQDETKLFLERAFGRHEWLGSQYVLFWTLPDKASAWFSAGDIPGSVAHIQKVAPTHEVYMQCGLSPKALGANERCKAEDVSGIVGFWADIDIQTPYRKKKNLPPTMEEAQKILKGIPFKVSLLVHSGGGYQAWWLLQEPWIFENDEERQRAMTLAKGVNALLRREAHKLGYVVDSVHDLSRVMRVPGTFNHKTDNPIPIKIVENNEDAQYDPDSFEEIIPEDISSPAGTEAIEVSEFTVDAGAAPPFRKFMDLMKKRKFKQTWNRTRKDTAKWSDTSASSWDMAVASILVENEFSDQEVVDTLIYYRSEHGDKEKLREDYYRRTIQKARSGNSDGIDEEERERMESIALDLIRKGNSNDDVTLVLRRKFPDSMMITEITNKMRVIHEDETKRKEREEAVEKVVKGEEGYENDDIPTIIEGLNKRLGINIVRIIKYLTDPPTYRLVLGDRSLRIGDVSNLIEQRLFRKQVSALFGKFISPIRSRTWSLIAQQLLDICEEEDPGADTTEGGLAKTWIRGFLESSPPVVETDGDDWQVAAISNSPIFRKGGDIFIPTKGLLRYIRKVEGDRVTNSHLGVALRHLGGDNSESLQFRYEGAKILRRGWTFGNGWANEL